MNQATVAVVFVVAMLVIMGIGVPMAFALVLTGAAMAWGLGFWDTQLLAQNLVAGVDSFPLLAVPFFILAGELMNAGGISRRIIEMAQAWVGHIRGGLGARRHRGARDHPPADDADPRLPDEHIGRAHRIGGHHRAHHSAVHALR